MTLLLILRLLLEIALLATATLVALADRWQVVLLVVVLLEITCLATAGMSLTVVPERRSIFNKTH
jgi:hypothetical protein